MFLCQIGEKNRRRKTAQTNARRGLFGTILGTQRHHRKATDSTTGCDRIEGKMLG